MIAFQVVDGSATHRDILCLKHLFGVATELEAVETAVRLQAQLARSYYPERARPSMQLRIVPAGSKRKRVFTLEFELPTVTGEQLASSCEALGRAVDEAAQFLAQAADEVRQMAKTASGRRALAAGYRFGQF